MKYHTSVKFVAIVLCAAALFGMVSGALGVGVLTALDLYDKTPDQVREENTRMRGLNYADYIATRYASTELGGLHPDALHNSYGWYTPFRAPNYSYELLDAEGNVLKSENFDFNADYVRDYTFQVSGKYIYVVSETPRQSEWQASDYAEEPDIPEETIVLMDEPALMALDAETAPVTEAPAETAAPEEEPAETAAPAEAPDEGAAEESDEAAPEEEDSFEEEASPEEEEAEPEEAHDEEAEPPAQTEAAVTEPPVEADEAAIPAGQPVDSVSPEEPDPIGTPVPSAIPEPQLVNGHPLSDYNVMTDWYYNSDISQEMEIKYVYLDSPEYTFVLHLADGAMDEDAAMPLLNALWNVRSQLLPLLGLSLLAFAIVGVYLCCAAGRRPKSDEIRAAGLNRVPLELYAVFTILAIGFGIVAVAETAFELLQLDLRVVCTLLAGCMYLGCLLVVGFLYALVAQMKTPGRFWLTNSLCAHCLRLIVWAWNKFIDACIWLARFLSRKVFPLLARVFKALWQLCRSILRWIFATISKCIRWIGVQVDQFLSRLPLIWQWLLTGVFMVFLLALLCSTRSAFGVFIGLVFTIGIVLLGCNAFGTLLDATRRMSRGNLNTKIDDRLLFGCFKDFAHNLNALANVAVVAAQKQLKSERMKTELITNVSHDIKTPLTSIINYVDLLQKPHSEEEQEKYLEVLARQSQQLKKLIEDLIEMSKASTGNMSVDIAQLDAVESVNQALGEFADKLDKAQLTPVFRHSEDAVPMMADGKLTWRVLHNILSNAVKYALPGTRLYIDLMQLEGKVILSMKNISRDELNIDAEELMERFVRGDGSRNTEGSGLGLNIAKSMMELQKGSLQLLVDGDLFKVTLIFPGA